MAGMPPGSMPPFGATVTTTLQTTVTAQNGASSVRIDYPWPESTEPVSYTAVTLKATVSVIPQLPFGELVTVASPAVYTQTANLPVLMLTNVEALIVDDGGKTLGRGTLTQPGPLWLGAEIAVGTATSTSVGSTSTTATTPTTTPTTTASIVPTIASCSGGFNCWSKVQQLGLIVGATVAGSILLGLLLIVCCWRRANDRELDISDPLYWASPTYSDGDVERAPMGPRHPHSPRTPHSLVPVSTVPAPGFVAAVTTDSNHETVDGPLEGLLYLRRTEERPSISTEISADQSSESNSLRRAPPAIPQKSGERKRRPNYKTDNHKAAEFFGVPAIRIHDFAYPLTGQPPPLTYKEIAAQVRDREMKIKDAEKRKAAQRAEAQRRYIQGHLDRFKGEKRRRERSREYDRRGDRLRKESPHAKTAERAERTERVERREGRERRERTERTEPTEQTEQTPRSKRSVRKRSTSEPLSNLKVHQDNYSLFNLNGSPVKDVEHDSSNKTPKRERTRDAEIGGRVSRPSSRGYVNLSGSPHQARRKRALKRHSMTDRSMGLASGEFQGWYGDANANGRNDGKKTLEHKFKEGARARSASTPAVPRESSRRKHQPTASSAKPVDIDDIVRVRSKKDKGKGRASPIPHKRASIDRENSFKEKDKHRTKDRDTGKHGEREFGRYGSRNGRDPLGPANLKHSKQPVKTANSPKKRLSNFLDLLPLPLPLGLEALHKFAEPEGYWDSIPRKETKVERSESLERREMKEERARRRAIRRAERAGLDQKVPSTGRVKDQVEELDHTIKAFQTLHKDGAKKKRLSRERRERENEEREREEALRSSGYVPRGRQRSGSPAKQAYGGQGWGYTVQRAGGVKANSGAPRAGKGAATPYPPRVTRHLPSPAPKYPYRDDTRPSPSRPSRSLSRKHVNVVGEHRNTNIGVDGMDGAYGAGSPKVARHASSGNRSLGAITVDTNDTSMEEAWEQIQEEELMRERAEMRRMGGGLLR